MGKKANVEGARRGADERVGQEIAERYRLEQLIGAGGMGVVYRATHLWTGRDVAVKLLDKDASETASRRFLREARTAAAVRHPHLVEVIDVGAEGDGAMYLVLELLEGESLSQHLKRKGAMRPADALDVLIPILDALDALHRAEVAHRDIKPGNIYLSLDGTSRVIPKLLDLGISKKMSSKEALTATGAVLGTPHYMSPEMACGDLDVGKPADIWAMGVVLFEAMAGERPFRADSIPGLLHLIATTRPVSVAVKCPDLPRGIVAAIDTALAYDAANRPATPAALADALVEAAVDAGWALSSRMPSGPRISLEPLMPAIPADRELAPMSALRSSASLETAAPEAPETPETPRSEREPTRRPWAAMAGAAVLATIIGVGGAWALTNQPDVQSSEPVLASEPPEPLDETPVDEPVPSEADEATRGTPEPEAEPTPFAEEPVEATSEPAVTRPRRARPRPRPRPDETMEQPVATRTPCRGANGALIPDCFEEDE